MGLSIDGERSLHRGFPFCSRDTAKAGEKPPGKRVKRVAGYLFLNFALTRGCREAEEVFHGAKAGGLHVFPETSFSYSGVVRNRKSFLKSILLHSSVVPAETPR